MRGQRGVTLVELLISMLILGAVMSLVAQAVSQVERIVRVADESQQLLSERWGGGWALQLLFANLVAPREGGAEPFRGESQSLTAYSTASLLDGDGGLRGFELRLRPAQDQALAQLGHTELLYQQRDPAGRAQGDARVVALFPGVARFAYRDQSGRWLAQWPRPGAPTDGVTAERLPSAVRVAELDGDALFISYPVLASGAIQRGEGASPFGVANR